MTAEIALALEVVILALIAGPIAGVMFLAKHGKIVGLASGLGFAQGLLNLLFGIVGATSGIGSAVVMTLLQGGAMIVFAVAAYKGRLWGLAGLCVITPLYVVLSVVTTGSAGWIIPVLIYFTALISRYRAQRTTSQP